MARTLGSEIRKIRKLKGMSLNAAAKPAGLSATYLQKLERDEVESPSPHRLRRIAEALGLEYSDLFRLAGYPLPTGRQASANQDRASGIDEVSLLRKAFQSDEFVSDEELEQLALYLGFLRGQKREAPSDPGSD